LILCPPVPLLFALSFLGPVFHYTTFPGASPLFSLVRPPAMLPEFPPLPCLDTSWWGTPAPVRTDPATFPPSFFLFPPRLISGRFLTWSRGGLETDPLYGGPLWSNVICSPTFVFLVLLHCSLPLKAPRLHAALASYCAAFPSSFERPGHSSIVVDGDPFSLAAGS